MLSQESQTVYNIICSIAQDSEVYKIVDADEITSQLPSDMKLTKGQLSQIIRDLKDREYVDIKYFTPDEYCLRVIKRIEDVVRVSADGEEGVTVTPAPMQQRISYGGNNAKQGGVKHGLVFFMSFLGGILGSGVVATVTALIFKFVL